MHNIKTYFLGMVPAIIIFMLPPHALAASYHTTFSNKFQTDAVYLFLYDGSPNRDVIFQNVTFSGPSSWGVAVRTDTFLHFSGAHAAGPGDLNFDITFADGRISPNIIPFRLEWTEYLNGGPSASDAMGSLSLERNRGQLGLVASSSFNSTVPTPIPGSTWLLMSGIFFLAGVRRQTGR